MESRLLRAAVAVGPAGGDRTGRRLDGILAQQASVSKATPSPVEVAVCSEQCEGLQKSGIYSSSIGMVVLIVVVDYEKYR